MDLSYIEKFLTAGYRRRTLLSVSLFTATFCIAMISIFFIQDLRHKKIDDEKTVRAVTKMLSESMRLPLYADNIEELERLAALTINTFRISKIQIVRPDGTPYMEIPKAPIHGAMATSRSPIVMNPTLDPKVYINGETLAAEHLGIVIASTTGDDRMRELLLALAYLSAGGFLLWVISTYICYLIMRKLTNSFDSLVDSISCIEQGKAETINIQLYDEAALIAGSINRLSQTLHDRERQNLSLQQQLTNQMEQRAESAEQIMQAKLIHADKMASLGMLVGCMGHEINNPNAMIRLHIELIKRVCVDTRPIMQAFISEEGNCYLGGYPYIEADKLLFDSIDAAHNQTFRIERVISELRNYATADSKEKKLIGLDRAVFGTMVLLNPELKRYEGKINNMIDNGNKRSDSAEVYTGPDRRARIFANQYSLQQVIVNLLSNSIRATKNLRTDGKISIEILSHLNTVEMRITDNGEGIHPEDIPKLCDPYFSRNLNSGGTGLGLFIANQIINDHGGTMNFISDLGVGTTVSIKFPVCRDKEIA